MKKTIYSLFCLLLLYSCITRLENNTRLLIKGVVQNQDNEPLNNVSIRIYTKTDILLGEGYSIVNGNFEVVSLFDAYEEFKIEISLDETYSKYTYTTNTENFTPDDLTIDLDTVRLVKRAVFNYDINRTSGINNEMEFVMTYVTPLCYETFIDGVINTSESLCFPLNSFNNTLDDNQPNRNGSFEVPLNSEVSFEYAINGGATTTETIIVNDLDYNYEFTY